MDFVVLSRCHSPFPQHIIFLPKYFADLDSGLAYLEWHWTWNVLIGLTEDIVMHGTRCGLLTGYGERKYQPSKTDSTNHNTNRVGQSTGNWNKSFSSLQSFVSSVVPIVPKTERLGHWFSKNITCFVLITASSDKIQINSPSSWINTRMGWTQKLLVSTPVWIAICLNQIWWADLYRVWSSREIRTVSCGLRPGASYHNRTQKGSSSWKSTVLYFRRRLCVVGRNAKIGPKDVFMPKKERISFIIDWYFRLESPLNLGVSVVNGEEVTPSSVTNINAPLDSMHLSD